MKDIQHAQLGGRSPGPSSSTGQTLGGISFTEFFDRLNEQSSLQTPVKKGFKGLVTAIINIFSLGMFKNITG